MNNQQTPSFNPIRWTRDEWMRFFRDTLILYIGILIGRSFF